ncbi:MAG: TonB family protein [Elusimicrobia bacterium]|nr:TonB family protein [Elusimicrobiota bacterium]
MNTVDEVLGFLAHQSEDQVQWGKPFSISAGLHALGLLLFFLGWQLNSLSPMPPVKVLEINVMGKEDLALKGTGHDYSQGPMPDKTMIAQPPRGKGAVLKGNTAKISNALKSRNQPEAVELPSLKAKGPLFGSGGPTPVSSGVGREKIYMAASAVRLANAGKTTQDKGDGEGLVGVPGGTVDLSAKRGSGGDAKGTGNFLSGGEGSVDGGSILQRRGQTILAEYPVSSDTLNDRENASFLELPDPPDDDFFSIRGPLGRRKITKMNLPRYPRWAEESGVEAQVSVRLTVTPNGRVKSGLYIERTSGFPELDKLVMSAIQQMMFAPLSSKDGNREEWGVATFNFKLRKASARG